MKKIGSMLLRRRKDAHILTTAEHDGMKRIIHEDTDFDTVETYKSIRTNIMFSMPKTERGKVIVITSSMPNEGKTTASINLAITFSQMGAKVLLMDCDLRKARVHRYLGIERDKGVTNVLCGFTEIDKAVHKNVRENMDVLTAGDIPPNPAELLETDEFVKMINELQEKYDYVFIDTPPTTVVTDAAIAMRHSSGVVVVVRQNVTGFELLDITMNNIAKAGAKVLGLIVLGVEEKTKRYYGINRYGYKYKYKYKYDYAYKDDKGKKK